MRKAILVIDDPKFCFNCPLAKTMKHSITKENYWLCGIGHNGKYGEWVYEPIDMISEIKPDWCPLQSAPEVQEVWYDDEHGDWERGYNSCLQEILGE